MLQCEPCLTHNAFSPGDYIFKLLFSALISLKNQIETLFLICGKGKVMSGTGPSN